MPNKIFQIILKPRDTRMISENIELLEWLDNTRSNSSVMRLYHMYEGFFNK